MHRREENHVRWTEGEVPELCSLKMCNPRTSLTWWNNSRDHSQRRLSLLVETLLEIFLKICWIFLKFLKICWILFWKFFKNFLKNILNKCSPPPKKSWLRPWCLLYLLTSTFYPQYAWPHRNACLWTCMLLYSINVGELHYKSCQLNAAVNTAACRVAKQRVGWALLEACERGDIGAEILAR